MPLPRSHLDLEILGSSNSSNALDRQDWKLSSTNNEGDLSDAIDGDIKSRWATQQSQKPGQKFKIDFGRRESFQKIVVETPENPDDFPRGYTVRGSNDGKQFTAIASGKGEKGSTTTIKLPSPATFQYLEIEQTGKSSSNWWSIHEINLLLERCDLE